MITDDIYLLVAFTQRFHHSRPSLCCLCLFANLARQLDCWDFDSELFKSRLEKLHSESPSPRQSMKAPIGDLRSERDGISSHGLVVTKVYNGNRNSSLRVGHLFLVKRRANNGTFGFSLFLAGFGKSLAKYCGVLRIGTSQSAHSALHSYQLAEVVFFYMIFAKRTWEMKAKNL